MSADESVMRGMLDWECVCVFVTVEEVYSTNGASWSNNAWIYVLNVCCR
jgi:hypothetical protein